MRLQSLHLQNYRSFGDCTLDLSTIRACVLCGPTGAGKSSLIDGTLWALFGKQRGRDYQKLGTDTTSVSVTFSSNGTTYRVTRTRSTKTKAGKSDLQFAAQNGAGWTPLGGKSIAETEAAIERLLGMDYNALLAGPISLQGESDRFTRPPDIRIDGRTYTGSQARIQILAQMLGLGTYADLRQRATAEARELDAKAAILETQQASARAELEKRAEIEAQKTIDQLSLDTFREDLARLDLAVRSAEREAATLEAQLPGMRSELAAFGGDKQALKLRESERASKVAKADRYRQILDRRQEIEAKAAQAEETTRTLAETRQELTILDESIARVRGERDRVLQANVAAQKANAKILQDEQRIKTESKGLTPLIAGHERRAAVMESVPCLTVDDLAERCPLLKDARESKAQLAPLCSKRHNLDSWERPALQIEQPTTNADQELRRLNVKRTDLTDRIGAAERTLSDCARWTALVPEIKHADQELPDLVLEIGGIEMELSVLRMKLAGEQAVTDRIGNAERNLRMIKSDLSMKRASVANAQASERNAVQIIAQAEAQLAALDKLAAETADAAAEANALRTRHAILATLADAYRAIPLMILENQAVPYLETEANRILARISRNGMRVELRTQREVKSRDTLADALDIIVRDQIGERSYEDYSGGQNFQVDLALRIALAKLQGRRAGQPVQTLILDEGFGTQSAECLDGIMEALRAVQGEFPLLLVVSHVEAMRDTFGARIEVAGGPQDSRAELVIA